MYNTSFPMSQMKEGQIMDGETRLSVVSDNLTAVSVLDNNCLDSSSGVSVSQSNKSNNSDDLHEASYLRRSVSDKAVKRSTMSQNAAVSTKSTPAKHKVHRPRKDEVGSLFSEDLAHWASLYSTSWTNSHQAREFDRGPSARDDDEYSIYQEYSNWFPAASTVTFDDAAAANQARAKKKQKKEKRVLRPQNTMATGASVKTQMSRASYITQKSSISRQSYQSYTSDVTASPRYWYPPLEFDREFHFPPNAWENQENIAWNNNTYGTPNMPIQQLPRVPEYDFAAAAARTAGTFPEPAPLNLKNEYQRLDKDKGERGGAANMDMRTAGANMDMRTSGANMDMKTAGAKKGKGREGKQNDGGKNANAQQPRKRHAEKVIPPRLPSQSSYSHPNPTAWNWEQPHIPIPSYKNDHVPKLAYKNDHMTNLAYKNEHANNLTYNARNLAYKNEQLRTTFMMRNIPNKYTRMMLQEALAENNFLPRDYDFLYLPIDFHYECNVGYAFINLVSHGRVTEFVQAFDQKKFKRAENSSKICKVTPAKVQGQVPNANRYKNNAVMDMQPEYRPIFYKNGYEIAPPTTT